MSLKERSYSVLIVSASESLNTILKTLLPQSRYESVQFAPDISCARRMLMEREYDYVIINSPLPDDVGTRFAIDVCNSKNSVVLLLIRNELHDAVYDKVAEHGVFTLPKPTSKPILLMAFGWMSSARERLRRSEKKNISIEEKMEEIRIVNRAKWLLISEIKMTEPDAHRYIEKQAMDRCITKRQVAEEIMKAYS